jgi:hypothetical protein
MQCIDIEQVCIPCSVPCEVLYSRKRGQPVRQPHSWSLSCSTLPLFLASHQKLRPVSLLPDILVQFPDVPLAGQLCYSRDKLLYLTCLELDSPKASSLTLYLETAVVVSGVQMALQ